ncbi:RNA-binding protein 34 [Hetaerina americana]|uniref:RNA-binding protein 34 n=1 Tax=Hetaerina americana TaxID=62018 RepID=UPI003A7F475F
MDFHVGSLADLINRKTHGKVGKSKLFQNVSSGPGKEVQFKVIPAAKRKRIPDQDEAEEFTNQDLEDESSYNPKLKRFKRDNVANAAKRLQDGKTKIKQRIVNPEEDKRTIFVGNLPCNIKVTKLKKMFKSYGEIESARLRCPPVKDPRIPKKVAVIKKDFHPERTNIVGYVRFTSEEEATAALQANGQLCQAHRIRVDLSSRNKSHDQKKAVFVGNVHFSAEENDLWKVFEHCGEIDSIRIVRDSQTGVGKGFAYINFKDLSSVALALKLDGQELKERALRVKRAVKKVKVKKVNANVGWQERGQAFKRVGRGKFAGKNQLVENKREFKEQAERFPKAGNREPRQTFKRGGKGKFENEKQFVEYSDKFEEKSENAQKVKKKEKLKLKPKTKIVQKPARDGPSFLGNKMDENVKVKKKKLSKDELKKRVLAFQLQLKKSGISDQ